MIRVYGREHEHNENYNHYLHTSCCFPYRFSTKDVVVSTCVVE